MLKRKILVHKKNKILQSKQASGLSDEEIERMVKEAEANAEADKKRKEEADLKNEADQLVFMAEKTLKDLEGKVSEEEVKNVEEAKEELKAALEAANFEEIRTKKEKLEEIVQQISMKLYEQAAAEAALKVLKMQTSLKMMVLWMLNLKK